MEIVSKDSSCKISRSDEADPQVIISQSHLWFISLTFSALVAQLEPSVLGKSLLKGKEGKKHHKWQLCDFNKIEFLWRGVSSDGRSTIESKSLREKSKNVLTSLGRKCKIG
jgi:hypothetical protein